MPSGRITEDDSDRMAASLPDPADAVAHCQAIIPARVLDRSAINREQDGITLG
jgi:hypothetical protein